MTLTEQIAAVLARHVPWGGSYQHPDGTVEPTCTCGSVEPYRAHAATLVAPLVRQAQAEAWDEWYFRGVGLTPPDGFNPYRADRIEAEA